ncbi:hypothetical protein SAMN05216227_10785 [Pseudorhodobacter antarcticus]|uniref:Uncharacterized protein n=1 Tax=Pseudorhodobacter antarcticus TaxID=1077947 RepID=A0A1H8NCU8_9RHOB|nr:hypothetical protein SAMN05216227_10785 [Pseudorhodobacter antarcticus]
MSHQDIYQAKSAVKLTSFWRISKAMFNNFYHSVGVEQRLQCRLELEVGCGELLVRLMDIRRLILLWY